MTTIDEERSVVIFGGGTSRVCVCEQSTVERLISRPPCPCSLSSSSSLVCGSRSVLGVYFIFVSRRSSRRGGEEEVAADVDKDKEGEDGEVEGEEDEEEEEESQEATTVGEEEKESLLLLLSLEWSGEEDTEVAVAR